MTASMDSIGNVVNDSFLNTVKQKTLYSIVNTYN